MQYVLYSRIIVARSSKMMPSSIYKTVIRPVPLYGSDTGVMRKSEQNLLRKTEISMSRWIMGMLRIEKIRNEEIRPMTGVANINEKIREARLIWLGHVERQT